MTGLRSILRDRRGFTLLELMVVMVILVLLAGLVSVLVLNRVEEAKHAKAVSDVESLSNAIDQFYLHCGQYPSTEDGLSALRTKPQNDALTGWQGPYIKRAVPDDPWGQNYVYVCPGDHNQDSYDLYSLGRDKKEGGTGSDQDITNWDTEKAQ